MAILNRIPGNPKALAVLFVALLAIFFAYIMEFDFDKKILAGALLGAGVSAIVTMIIRFLEEPSLGKVPQGFSAAAIQEVNDRGYYCRDYHFTFKLNTLKVPREERDVEGKEYLIKGKLTIDYSSTIVPIAEGAKVRRPDVIAPAGLILLKIDYFHKNKHGKKKVKGSPETVSEKTRECCTIVYGIKDDCKCPIKDEHRWRCPVEDFRLTAPQGYEFHASLLREYPPDAEAVGVGAVRDKALFSQQGFRWSIG